MGQLSGYRIAAPLQFRPAARHRRRAGRRSFAAPLLLASLILCEGIIGINLINSRLTSFSRPASTAISPYQKQFDYAPPPEESALPAAAPQHYDGLA
jgi:hypothetical protein